MSSVFRKLKTTFSAIPSILFARSTASVDKGIFGAKILQQSMLQIEAGKTYRLLNWNTHTTSRAPFFYDGGPDVVVELVKRTLLSISDVLAETIALLQKLIETGQNWTRRPADVIAQSANLSCAHTPYHHCAYVPPHRISHWPGLIRA